MKRATLIIMVGIIVLTLSACSMRIGYFGMDTPGHMKAKFFSLTDRKVESFSAKKGEVVCIDYSSEIKRGSLTIKLQDSDGNALATFEPNTTGSENVAIKQDGTYRVVVDVKARRGNYDISWEVTK